MSVEEAAALAAYGLFRMALQARPGAADRDARSLRRRSESATTCTSRGSAARRTRTPSSATARRVRNDAYAAAAEAVLDHIAGNLTPGGTYWPQWTHDRGWTWGWHPDHDRAHARTLADAALFMLRRAAAGRASALQNVAVALRTQRDDGALPAAHSIATGDAKDWEGTAGMAWIPALVEAGELDAARRAGEYYKRFDTWYGAPEDVDLAPTSEDGYAAVMAFVALEDWETARRAADWTLTFRYSYDVDFAPGTPLGDMAFKSRGADQASAANQHLHNFGLVCLPEFLALGEPYRSSVLQHLECFRQSIARYDGDFGAQAGMEAERYCRPTASGRRATCSRSRTRGASACCSTPVRR